MISIRAAGPSADYRLMLSCEGIGGQGSTPHSSAKPVIPSHVFAAAHP